MEPGLLVGSVALLAMVTRRDEEARDKAVRAYIRRRIDEMIEAGATTTSIGEQMKLSHVSVVNMRKREEQGQKCGPKAQQAFANAYFDGSMDRLVDAAMGRSTQTVVPLSQYPDGELAAEVARREGIAPEAIRQVLEDTHHSDAEGWTLQDWVEEMRARARRMKRGGAHVDEVDVVDEAPAPVAKKRAGKR